MNLTPSITVLNTDIHIVDGLYSLNDLHRAAGGEKRHQPNNWLRIDQTRELIEEIEHSSDLRTDPIKTVNGGKAPGTYACKELVYAYAMWVSAKFHLAVIRAFDALVSGREAARPAAPALPGNATHLADQVVAATRTFSALLRAARGMGMSRPRAVHRAAETARQFTGVDLIAELRPDLDAGVAAEMQAESSLDGFLAAWREGSAPLPLCPCRSSALHRAYALWCDGRGEQTLSAKQMAARLDRLPGWFRGCKSVVRGDRRQPERVVIPAEAEMRATGRDAELLRQPGEPSAVWMGRCLTAFESALAEWAGEA